jgi:hypothetical protein
LKSCKRPRRDRGDPKAAPSTAGEITFSEVVTAMETGERNMDDEVFFYCDFVYIEQTPCEFTAAQFNFFLDGGC